MYKKFIFLALEALVPFIIDALVKYLKRSNQEHVLSEKQAKKAEEVIKKSKVAEEQLEILKKKIDQKKLSKPAVTAVKKETAEEILRRKSLEAVYKASKPNQ